MERARIGRRLQNPGLLVTTERMFDRSVDSTRSAKDRFARVAALPARPAKDPFARLVAFVAFVVAAVALGLPFFQQWLSGQRDLQLFDSFVQESVIAALDPYVNGEIRLTSHDLGTEGQVVQMPWQLTLRNAGDQETFIVEYALTRGDSGASMLHSGINGGFLSEVDSGVFGKKLRPIQWPIALSPGETRSFTVLVGIPVPRAVFHILSSLGKPNPLDTRRAMIELAKNGTDLFGNDVEYREYPNDRFAIIQRRQQPLPRYWLRLTTRRGNAIVTSVHGYDGTKPIVEFDPNRNPFANP